MMLLRKLKKRFITEPDCFAFVQFELKLKLLEIDQTSTVYNIHQHKIARS